MNDGDIARLLNTRDPQDLMYVVFSMWLCSKWLQPVLVVGASHDFMRRLLGVVYSCGGHDSPTFHGWVCVHADSVQNQMGREHDVLRDVQYIDGPPEMIANIPEGSQFQAIIYFGLDTVPEDQLEAILRQIRRLLPESGHCIFSKNEGGRTRPEWNQIGKPLELSLGADPEDLFGHMVAVDSTRPLPKAPPHSKEG